MLIIWILFHHVRSETGEDTPLVGVTPEAEKSEVPPEGAPPEGAPEGNQATDATGAVATESGAQGTEGTEGAEGAKGTEGKETGGVEPTGETQKELPAGPRHVCHDLGKGWKGNVQT